MKREFIHFETRQDRPRWITKRFAYCLEGSVLDVGCDKAILREFVGKERYVGIDRSAEADVHHDLQSGGKLPFEDGAFDTVVCTDVLEHLDNLHAVYEEIVRVAKRHVLISLPNNWNAARVPIRRGRGSFTHYGLPVDPPVDRHRWFFSLDEARAFLEARAARHRLETIEYVVAEKPRSELSLVWKRLVYPRLGRYLNLHAHTLVGVFAK